MAYHHGDLRRTLLDTALASVAEHGPTALSLREVARRAGVSHAAPTHHFGDKTGLLTALATDGWNGLAEALAGTRETGGTFRQLGVAYVVYTTTHAAHFAVMRAPDLVRGEDPELCAARDRAGEELRRGAMEAQAATTGRQPSGLPATGPDDDPGSGPSTALAGWALMHGLAALVVEGLVQPDDVEGLAWAVTGALRY